MSRLRAFFRHTRSLLAITACLFLWAHRAEAQGFGGGSPSAFQSGFGQFGNGFQGGFGQFGSGFQGGGFNFGSGIQIGGLQFGGGIGGGAFNGNGFQGGNFGGSQFGGGQFGGQFGGGINFGGGQAFSVFSGSFKGQPGFTILVSGSGSQSGSQILAIDSAAIASCIISGVPVALSQRELLLHATRASTGDVNERLFRLRAQAESKPPPDPPPVASGKKAAQSVQPSPMEIRSADGRFTIFAGASYAAADLDWRGVSSAFQADTWTGTIGAEIRMTDHLVLGLAGTYLNTQGDFDTRGSVDAEGFAIAAYLSYTHGNCYADLLYSFGNFEEDIQRRTGLGTTARAEPDSENHSIEFNTGYNFHFGALTTGPIIGLDYRNGNLESYDEHGDPRASLGYEDQNYDSLVTRVGWQASYKLKTGFGAITTQVRAAWERENLDENEFIKVSLVNSPYHWIAGGSATPEYSVSARTTSPDADYLNVGGGFLIEIGPNFSIILDYQGHVFRSDSVEHFGSIMMSLKF